VELGGYTERLVVQRDWWISCSIGELSPTTTQGGMSASVDGRRGTKECPLDTVTNLVVGYRPS
jgi:hypothetical protein